MKAIVILILALVGGAMLYDESPEFRSTIDQIANDIEEANRSYESMRGAEMEIQAFDRRDAFRTRSTEPAASYVGAPPTYGQKDAQELIARDLEMKQAYQQAVSTLRTNHGRAPQTRQHMSDYVGAREAWDAGRHAQRDYPVRPRRYP